jgi:hypothetical protein
MDFSTNADGRLVRQPTRRQMSPKGSIVVGPAARPTHVDGTGNPRPDNTPLNARPIWSRHSAKHSAEAALPRRQMVRVCRGPPNPGPPTRLSRQRSHPVFAGDRASCRFEQERLDRRLVSPEMRTDPVVNDDHACPIG